VLRAVASGGAQGAGGFFGAGVSSVLAKSGIPLIIPPTGTMANNGAVTLGTALATTYAQAFMWFAANQIAAGVGAGWYYTVMSSTTVGQVFNNTYSGTGVPVVPASPTAFATTGPGAFTGSTSAQNMVGITIPAGAVSGTGAVRVSSLWSVPSNADSKAITVSVGGQPILNNGVTTNLSFAAQNNVYARGAANAVAQPQGLSGIGASAANAQYFAINWNANQTVQFSGQMVTAATDYVVLEGWTVEVMP
jgi:hypothetical protein